MPKITKEDFQNALKDYEVKNKELQIASQNLNKLREQTSNLEDNIIGPYCEKRVVEVFGKTINLSFYSFYYVSHSSKSIRFPSIIELISRPGEPLAHIGDGKFLWLKDLNFNFNSRGLYPRQIIKDKEPFDSSHLLKLCDDLSKELGFRVEFRAIDFVESFSGTHPYCVEDLFLIHENCKVLCRGDIEYENDGWNIDDEWVLIEDFDGKHLYYGTYGTTAQRGGLNVHIKPGESYESFLNPSDDVRIENLSQAKSFLS